MGKALWVATAVVVAGAAVGGYTLLAGEDDSAATDGETLLITDQAERRTLRDEVTVRGTLERVEQRKVNAAADGRVSVVYADDGDTVEAGQAIFALDGRDAVAVAGDLGFYRSLDVGAEGADVTQLEQVLADAGFDPGPVDRLYTEQTRFALAQWQAARAYPGTVPETDETITVALGQSTGYRVGAQSSAAVVIGPTATATGPGEARAVRRAPVVRATNDGIITLTIRSLNDVTAEGAPASFLIEADEEPLANIQFTLQAAGLAGSTDIIVPSVPFVLPARTRSITVSIPTRADDLVENEELLEVYIVDGPDHDVGVPSLASTRIMSDDLPELTLLGGASVAEGVGAQLTITTDQPSPVDVQVALSVSGTATPDSDYAALDPLIRIPAGQSAVTVPITTLNDTAAEPDERLVVSLTQGNGYRIGEISSATITIMGDQASTRPVVQITASSGRIVEGQPAQFVVGLSQPLSEDLEIFLTYDGTVAENVDFTRAAGRLFIPRGQTAINVTVPTLNDDRVENDRSLWVRLAPTLRYEVSPQGAANVQIESEDLPEFQIIGGPGFLAEGEATSFTIVSDQAVLEDTSVTYQVVGSAQPGADFAPLTGTTIMPAGQRSVNVPLRTIDDDVVFRPTDMIVGEWPIRVGTMLVDEGQMIPAGTPLLSLTDATFTVTLRAGASDRTKLEVGQQVTVTLGGSTEESPGTITELDETATVDAATGEALYEGVVEMTGDLGAADGAGVTIEVVLDERIDALTVPIAAVKQDGSGNDVVRVLDLANNGTIVEKPVETGLTEGSYIEIVSGLVGDEIIVVEVTVGGGDAPT